MLMTVLKGDLAIMQSKETGEAEIWSEYGDNELIRDLPIMKYAGIETYDKRIVASLIEKVEVLGSTEMHVLWKHQDEYDRILGQIS